MINIKCVPCKSGSENHGNTCKCSKGYGLDRVNIILKPMDRIVKRAQRNNLVMVLIIRIVMITKHVQQVKAKKLKDIQKNGKYEMRILYNTCRSIKKCIFSFRFSCWLLQHRRS